MVVVIDLINPEIPSHVIEKELEETKLIETTNQKPRKIHVNGMTDTIATIATETIVIKQIPVAMIKNVKNENTKMKKGTKTIEIWTNHVVQIQEQRHHLPQDRTAPVQNKLDLTGMKRIVLVKLFLQRKL